MNGENKHYPLLDRINSSRDVSTLDESNLPQLCGEIREFLIDKVSKTGGHLSANLGTVELSVAMHHCFTTPADKFIFDVGHQCYTHKILTGRKNQFDKLRMLEGLSGFPSPDESDEDAFISGHGSTSISLAVGMARSKKIKREPGYVIAVVGDGAFTGGMVYEGLNNIDKELNNLIIILNDNKMSISKNVGAVPRYLSNLRTNSEYLNVKADVSRTLMKVPVVGKGIISAITASKSFIRQSLYRNTFFEDLGFIYHKVEDGNDVFAMCSALEAAKRAGAPVFIHAITVKGKGYGPAEDNPGEFHGVGAFDPENVPDPDVAPKDSYSTVFGKELSKLANKNDELCAITAAMKYGTGLQFFYRDHKSRFFDVGMAEEHAVTFAAALAKSGMQPVVCLYSTFMQRALDQYLHDVMILKQNVMFGIDRAGFVPGDGETHQGIFDIGIFANYEDTPVVSPSNYRELMYWEKYLIENVKGPKVIRYSRGGQDKRTADYPCSQETWDLIDNNGEKLIVCYGRHFSQCLEAVDKLKEQGINADILKLNFVNPIPQKALEKAKEYGRIHFYEEHAKNTGVGVRFARQMMEMRYSGKMSVHAAGNYILKRATVLQLWQLCGLDRESIVNDIKGE